MAGIDISIFGDIRGSIKRIIENPAVFFKAFGGGFVEGFKAFARNLNENIKAIFKNLLNLWLGAAGLSLPEEFSIAGIIKFGLQIIGIDVSQIFALFGIGNDAQEASPAGAFIKDLREYGLSALPKYLIEFAGDLTKSVISTAVELIAGKAAAAAIAKLAMLTTPVSGIVTVLKAVWDVIQFIRENMAAITGLAAAAIHTINAAALGNADGAAAGVEATLCQAIPLVIDLLLRLASIDVKSVVKRIVDKIRAQVKKAFDSLIKRFKTKRTKDNCDGQKKQLPSDDKSDTEPAASGDSASKPAKTGESEAVKPTEIDAAKRSGCCDRADCFDSINENGVDRTKILYYDTKRVNISRINAANGRTRFTPLRKSGSPASAGMNHVIEGHFNRPTSNRRSIFTITVEYLKEILNRKTIRYAHVSDAGGGLYKRITDTGEIIGKVEINSYEKNTSWIAIVTDYKGNLITAYPVNNPME